MHFFFELTKFNTHNSNHISETNKTFKKFMSPATKKQDGSYTTNKKIHTKKSHAMTLAIPKHTKKIKKGSLFKCQHNSHLELKDQHTD